MKKMTSTLAAALALTLAACDGDVTGSGGGDARLQVAARGDDAPASQSVSPAGSAPTYTHSTAQGTIDFRARVYVQSSTSGWVELTSQAASAASVSASGHGEAVAFASSRVKAGSYNRVRVVFETVDANISGGLRISTGGLLTGTVSVNLESDGQVVVEREVNVSASSGATTRLVLNLNADAWLSRANATTRTVAEAEFRNAVQITAM
ncbi:MAG TPA: hypothetical protein VHG93_22815 [Longimicrobium sp.]|nr:hypothetical protein [Longimicrobium sp.]